MIFLLAFLVIVLIIMIMQKYYDNKKQETNTQKLDPSQPKVIYKNEKELISGIMDDVIAIKFLTILENFDDDDVDKLKSNNILHTVFHSLFENNLNNYILHLRKECGNTTPLTNDEQIQKKGIIEKVRKFNMNNFKGDNYLVNALKKESVTPGNWLPSNNVEKDVKMTRITNRYKEFLNQTTSDLNQEKISPIVDELLVISSLISLLSCRTLIEKVEKEFELQNNISKEEKQQFNEELVDLLKEKSRK